MTGVDLFLLGAVICQLFVLSWVVALIIRGGRKHGR